MITKHFAIIKENKPWFSFDIHDINEHGLMSPILWCRDGEFRLMPKAVVENLMSNAAMYAELSDKRCHPKVAITWGQGIPVSNQAGRALIGE